MTKDHHHPHPGVAERSAKDGLQVQGNLHRTSVALVAVIVILLMCSRPGAIADASLHLRSEPTELSTEQVKAMLVTREFYDRNWNAVGKGVVHQYEQKVIAGQVVVLDSATGKTWQKAGAPGAMTQSETADYLKQLNTEQFAGFSDWRLPTLEEAISLMEPKERDKDRDKFHIDPVFERRQPFIWTSDRTPNGRGWVAYYADGIVAVEKPEFNAYVRAVR